VIITDTIKAISIVPVLAILFAAVTTSRVYADAGSDAGDQAARADFSSGVGYHGSCADHGYHVTQNPGFCLSFKFAYAAQWAVLVAGQ
jgi:hypothetical protein